MKNNLIDKIKYLFKIFLTIEYIIKYIYLDV